jgi:hypothetical protein
MSITKVKTKYPIGGEGKNLYIITVVDQDDTEDTASYLYRADDEDHLYQQLKADYVGDFEEDGDDFMDKEIEKRFEDDWGFSILFFEVGEISK